MAEYYLISQLPSLDGIGENTQLTITEERFLELCHRFLGEKASNELENLTDLFCLFDLMLCAKQKCFFYDCPFCEFTYFNSYKKWI